MKKFISLILVIVLSLAVVNIPTFALSTDSSNERIDVRDEILDEVFLERIKYTDNDKNYELSDVDIEYCYKIRDNIYLVRYRINGREYSDITKKEYADDFQEWSLFTSEPEPCIYTKGSNFWASNLIRLARAYPNGHITKEDLEYIATFEEIDLRKTKDVLLYREKFVEQYMQTAEGKFIGEGMLRDCYDEKYYHYDENSNIDWAMVSCGAIMIPYPHYAIFGDRVMFGDEVMPLSFDMAVYDVALEKFIDVVDIENISQYDGLEEYIAEFSYPLGDANMDGELTILDATYIQFVLAQLVTFPRDDLREYDSARDGQLNYMSDINRDGERTILDATAIQMKLAKVEDTVVE